MLRSFSYAAVAAAIITTSPTTPARGAEPAPEQAQQFAAKIQHIVVLYQENWSFDGLYGLFPGANGLANASKDALTQRDRNGVPLKSLPQPLLIGHGKATPDARFPASMPVAPYNLQQFVPGRAVTGDLVHRFYQEQLQIDGGKMDRFVSWSDNGGLTMSYYDASKLPEGRLAAEFTIADNTFHSAFGGSFIDHIWLIAAQSPPWPHPPQAMVADVDAKTGLLKHDGVITPDGYAINTVYPFNKPYPQSASEPANRLPPLTIPNIGDRLSAAGISWAWFSGGWDDAVAGHPDKEFQFHHQPFNYFAAYGDGKPGRTHLRDVKDFKALLDADQLPAVSFVKQVGELNEHPGYADLEEGQEQVAALVAQIRASRAWATTAIIITYDEHGGRWDHVAPPKIDRWGPGTRVPTIIISPYAKRHFVDHTQYESVSVLKTIEERWHLAPLSSRDAAARSFLPAFDFTKESKP